MADSGRATWAVGDRVRLSPRGDKQWTNGTITAIDEPGLPRGVRVLLDEFVNGIADCYASHNELRPADDA